jgi:hypothetical protein
MTPSRFAAAGGGALLVALLGSPSVADVISDWNTAVAPPPPDLKEVSVDPSTTALLFLDTMKDKPLLLRICRAFCRSSSSATSAM